MAMASAMPATTAPLLPTRVSRMSTGMVSAITAMRTSTTTASWIRQTSPSLKAALGKVYVPGPGVTPARLEEDINGNGIVDPQDFSIFKSKFGQPPGPSAMAP